MRWKRGSRSRNVDDRRHQSAGRRAGGSALPLLFMLARSRFGLAAIVVFVAFMWISGVDPLTLLSGAAAPSSGPVSTGRDAAEEELVQFVSFVLDDNQDTWTGLFSARGREYRTATLVLFRDAVRSACGFAQSATGPFYCPGDHQVYIDLGFYDDLRRRFGAPGDFAQAYVIAHEIGHHVQTLTGIEGEVRRLQRGRPDQANELSVRMELQADCLAGVWGRSAAQRDILEPGDLEEGLNAAAAIGDDRMQEGAGQGVNPDAFTHGSSSQRVEWLRRGFESGDPLSCDTFDGAIPQSSS